MRRNGLAARMAGLALAGLLALSPLALVGCDGQQASTPTTGDSQQTDSKDSKPDAMTPDSDGKAPTDAVTADMGQGDALVSLTNSLGFDLTSISVKASDAEDFDAKNVFEGVDFADGSTKTLGYHAVEGAKGYDLKLNVSVDGFFLVRDVDLANAKDVRLLMDEGVAYVSYTDATTGEERNNHDAAVEAAMDPDLPTYDKQTQAG